MSIRVGTEDTAGAEIIGFVLEFVEETAPLARLVIIVDTEPERHETLSITSALSMSVA